jgi:hypothetical protein
MRVSTSASILCALEQARHFRAANSTLCPPVAECKVGIDLVASMRNSAAPGGVPLVDLKSGRLGTAVT